MPWLETQLKWALIICLVLGPQELCTFKILVEKERFHTEPKLSRNVGSIDGLLEKGMSLLSKIESPLPSGIGLHP